MTHPPIPVLCDHCRVQGRAGEDPFAEIADLLDFTPVPVRAHANNWTAEHQRAFVAALATVGNERAAARSIGRYAGGAVRLRKSPRGKSFKEACENAIDLYREREHALLRESLAELDAEHRKALEDKRHVAAEMDYHRPLEDPGGEEADEDYVAEVFGRIAEKLWNCRRLFMMTVSGDKEREAAWELLTWQKPDWDRAAKGEPQDDEIEAMSSKDVHPPGLKNADMVLSGEIVGVSMCGRDVDWQGLDGEGGES